MSNGKVDIQEEPIKTVVDRNRTMTDYVKGELAGSDYFERRPEESQIEYQNRIHAYCAGLIGLIEAYDQEANLERLRQLLPLSKRVHQTEDEQATSKLIALIRQYQERIASYDEEFPSISDRYKVKKQRASLQSFIDE